jgi:hypothetical protein
MSMTPGGIARAVDRRRIKEEKIQGFKEMKLEDRASNHLIYLSDSDEDKKYPEEEAALRKTTRASI